MGKVKVGEAVLREAIQGPGFLPSVSLPAQHTGVGHPHVCVQVAGIEKKAV